MAIKIKFDPNHNVCPPTFVLATRSGRKLGAIPARSTKIKEAFSTYSELFFSVYKEENGARYHLWDKLKSLKLLWCREWNKWFDLTVELDESNELVKNVTAKSLGESELSQIKIYGTEINTESDISRDDYAPTIFCCEEDPSKSLLHRIMEKAPHYRIAHVATSIKNIQRTFSFDDISIYDALQEVSKEINCIVIMDIASDEHGKIDRAISVYDLESFCLDCGERGDFDNVCPKCASNNVVPGYGEDTTIFVSVENLADNITYTTDVDSVKNCFKLEGGDDLMTAAIATCNPNGSGYIWYMADEMKEDMSNDLRQKLSEYDNLFEYYQKEYTHSISNGLLAEYNALVEKYSTFSDEIEKLPQSIIGYPALMTAYYHAIDFGLFLESELMPSAEMQSTSAVDEASNLTNGSITSVAVQKLSICSASTADSAVLSAARVIVDSRYQVKIGESTYSNNTWNGNFIITNYSDEEDTVTTDKINISLTENVEVFIRQKIDKALNNNHGDITDVVGLFKENDDSFKFELTKYSLARLKSFYDACQACLNVLIEHGVAKDKTTDLYVSLYDPYYKKLGYISEEIKLRESEIAVVAGCFDANGRVISDGVQTAIDKERAAINKNLDFESFLGDDLWLEFIAYRREDTYKNDNYISDGLTNDELIANALEFIEIAKKDIVKSATLQHSISATLKNLLVMKEFEPIIDNFKVGNWIRIKVDGSPLPYKLRLLDYEVDFDDLSMLSVTFSDIRVSASGISDVKSILDKAVSMASSYGSVSRQAGQGKKSQSQLDDWVEKGLALTKMKIVDSAANQNITFDTHGLLCKEYLPFTDSYDPKQLKLINRGIYLTEDNWETSSVGVGDFTYYNPKTGLEEEDYGVIAKTLVGNLILSEEVGIYNTTGSVTLDENGIKIIADNTTGDNTMSFDIVRKTLDDDNNVVESKVMYLDSDGNLVLRGNVLIESSSDASQSSLENYYDAAIDNAVKDAKTEINETIGQKETSIKSSIEEDYLEQIKNIENQLNDFKDDVCQRLQFDSSGLTISAYLENDDGTITQSPFKTVMDNDSLKFYHNNQVVSFISGYQLYISNAAIQNTLILGNFFFSPHNNGDGGFSLTWQDTNL